MKSKPDLCLGIDPGFGRMGYGLVSQNGHTLEAIEYGCIETRPKDDLSKRLQILYTGVRDIINLRKPDFMSIEQLYFGRNTTTAGYVWQARGLVLLLASQFELQYYEPKPNQVKMAVCGSGSASKLQIQKMVQRLLNLEERPRPDDAADALAIAITGLALFAFAKKTEVGRDDKKS